MATDGVLLTRRRFIALGAAACASLYGRRLPTALGAGRTTTPSGYVSRPDLKPPAIAIAQPAQGTAPGSIFLAPFEVSTAVTGSGSTSPGESHSGPLVVDDRGEPVWFLPMATKTAMDFRVQEFRGRRVLTWYEGTVLGQYGGSFVIFDPTYHEVKRVTAGRGRHGDLHEFLLTSRGTALISIYSDVIADLTSVGGPSNGVLVAGIVQEVDVESGKVLFEWRSDEHVGLDESFMTEMTPAGNVDYFHLNSIAIDRDGNLLVSARHMSTIYKVDRRSGEVIWRLGGKKSDFTIDPAASFRFQHDARRHPDGTITIFDNNAALPGPGVASRAIRIALDTTRKQATLVREWMPTDPRAGWAMGNVQTLDDGGVFVGWGTDGSFSEFTRDGRLRFDARFADGSVTYRAFRLEWVAHPTGRPAVAVVQNGDGTITVYASWNGATKVAKWRVETGKRASLPTAAVTHRRTGFETAITVPAASGYVSVVALDVSGKSLGSSTAVAVV